MVEEFRPVSNSRPNTFFGKLGFSLRMILDLQLLTIFRDIKKELPAYEGNVLDVGCGQSPYRYLLNKSEVKYFGIDVHDSEKFGYNNPHITYFNGQDIPFEEGTFDGIICTEVIEHVHNYQKLINEIYRVMRVGGRGIITIPWSARYHYHISDFFRYTPLSLKIMFGQFSEVTIKSRGTDISVIANKLIVLWFRNFLPLKTYKWIFVPGWVILSPVLMVAVIIAHVSLLLNLGSNEDPLGYSILIRK